MADTTGISWTDHTFNPWRGCVAVSPACDHCYAEALTKRGGLDLWGKDADRLRTSEAYWRKPLTWDRQAQEDGRPHLVFCGSLCDVMEPRDDLDAIRADLWPLIESTPHLVWQLLTKRPEQVPRLVPAAWMEPDGWPAHVWMGTTVEDQAAARLRIPRLLRIPAPVRFLSMEPLLENVTLWPWAGKVQWVIVGGESGPNHRLLDLTHARALLNECILAEVPYLFKQVGGRFPTSGGHLLDGKDHHAFPSDAGDRSDGGPVAVREQAKAAAREAAVDVRA